MYIRKRQKIEDCFCGDINPSNVGMTVLYLHSQLFSAVALHLSMGSCSHGFAEVCVKGMGQCKVDLTALFLMRTGHPLQQVL